MFVLKGFLQIRDDMISKMGFSTPLKFKKYKNIFLQFSRLFQFYAFVKSSQPSKIILNNSVVGIVT